MKKLCLAGFVSWLLVFWSLSVSGSDLTTINKDFLIKPHEAYQWHLIKDSFGPTFSGGPAWRLYLAFLESKLKEYGVQDIQHNKWTYNRWFTTEWPDDSNWSLAVEGQRVRVAQYGAYSGSTPPEGITAPLVFFNPLQPPADIKGKIVVFATLPHPKPPHDKKYLEWFTLNDHEYISSPETFPPLFTAVPPSESVAYDIWWQIRQHLKVSEIVKKGGAAGGVIVFNASYDRVAGLYTFPLYPTFPWPLGVPILFLDRKAGAEVVEKAKAGQTANLKLLAKVEPTETYQLIGYLPGKNYGTPADEKILLATHTDGPAISQDNGGLGVLAVVAYFSRVPQAQRPRTLMIYLDNRHYMPTMEPGFTKEDWFTRNPETRKAIVGVIGLEHLGQVETREDGDVFEPTGKVEPSFLWARNNQTLIDMAIKAVKDHDLPRCMVQCVERAGKKGQMQGVWYGLGEAGLKALGREIGEKTPAFATMGVQGAYWATTARIDKFDKNHFVKQIAVMSQLTGELMAADLEKIRPVFAPGPGETQLFR
ncbi:MAG: hypothetical protein AB1641_06810 [Thermodesulfobacteriota bacterium]